MSERDIDAKRRMQWLSFGAFGILAGVWYLPLSEEAYLAFAGGFMAGIILGKSVFMAFLLYWDKDE